jgi:carboxymethylenebutenolidase
MTKISSDLQSSMVDLPISSKEGGKLSAYQVIPAGAGQFPGLIVIHEIFGLNENIRRIAERFAQEGYAVLAVDLFSGGNRVICMLQIMYGMLIRPLKNSVMEDLESALVYMRGLPEVDAGRTGVVGFCMGGTYALQLACVDNDLKAASVFYGQNPRPLEAVAQACPILGSYPEKDFTARAAKQLEPALEKYDVPHNIKIYPEARHSFFNDQGSAFNPDAASDAWKRMLGFFDQYIHPKS